MRLSDSVAGIHEMFCSWRKLGSREMAGGTELIGAFEELGETRYLHVLHSGLNDTGFLELEDALQVKLPRWLRCFYSRYGGMDLWCGAFVVFGLQRPGFRWPSGEIQPSDIVRFNYLMSCMHWFPPKHIAFAQNSLDMSVYLASLEGDEILRCDFSTGQVLEVFVDLFNCIEARLNKVDRFVADAAVLDPGFEERQDYVQVRR